jgi:dienelactone hydrolase
VTDPVMSGAVNLGDAVLTTSYTATTVTASVSPLSLVLNAGNRYQATDCLNTHVLGSAPEGRCDTTEIDARSASSAASYEVSGTSRTVDRPLAGNAGYVTEQVSVARLDGAAWMGFASSWPQTNLAGASLPLFAADASSGPVPAQQGIELPTAGHGGANTGLPDSMCVSSPFPPATPRNDLSTTALGDLGFYYEVGAPTGEYEGKPAEGVMILFHGGGWMFNGGGAAESLRAHADRWRARGWRTVNSSYRPCGLASADATAVYDTVRATYGAAAAVCTFGQSAGGQLALMVAASRPGGVYCVVDQAGPTDAPSLPGQLAYDPRDGGTQSIGPRWVYNLMVGAFGQENLDDYSPAQFTGAGLTGTRILAATAARDPLVPYAQMTLLRDRMSAADPQAYVDTMQLAAGDKPFTHGQVSQKALAAYERAERHLVAPLAVGQTPALVPPAGGGTDDATQGVLPDSTSLGGTATAAPTRDPAPLPRLRVWVPRRLHVTDPLTIHLTCIDRRCRVVAHVALIVAGPGRHRSHTYGAPAVQRSIAAHRRTTLVVQLPGMAGPAARLAWKARRTAWLRVTVVVTDALGNRRTLSRRVALDR